MNGASRLIGDAFANKITVQTLADSAGNTGTNGQVLKSDGNNIVWGSLTTGVSGVKGNAESAYRTGQVNLTAANVGAPTTTGSGASGTWGISISGNAATATSAGKITTAGTTAQFWRGDNSWSNTLSGGTLKITNNSNTLEIGSANTSWAHFTNSANIPFYFNHQINAVDGFKVYNTTTSLANNNLTFSQGGGWSMSDSTWIRTVGGKSVYMNTGTFRNDGITQLRTLQHVNANIATDGSWTTGTTGTANSGDNNATQGAQGTSILTIGNNIARPAAGTAGGANNSQGYLRLHSSGTGYGELTGYTTSANTHIYATNGFSVPENKIGFMFRPGSGSYYTHISYETSGNEALVAATQNAVTSFIFVNGESYANVASDRWTKLTGASGAGNAPGLQIKQNCVSIGELIPSGTNATYKLNVNGTQRIKSGSLQIYPTGGNYNDGIRIHARSADNTWAAITLCGADNTGDTGISANSWFLGNNGGNLYITRNGSSNGTAMLACVNNVWQWNGTAAGSISGNAATATKLANARTISLTGSVTGSGSFDGSGNISIATTTNHTHSYLPLSGGTLSGDLSFKTSTADSPDIVWYYGDTSKEQARIWMGSGGTTKWAPLYRCYKSDGTSLYSGNLVLGDGTGASGTWGISISGNAATATKLATARAIKIGNLSQDFDGSSALTYKMKDMQIAPHYHVGDTGNCTYLLATLNKETSWMYSFILRIYQGYTATDIQISGYNYGSSHWYSPQARIISSTSTGAIKVYFGYTGNYKLWVAVDGGSYTGAAIVGLVNGYTQVDFEDAITLTKVSALPGTTQTTQTIYRPWYRDEKVTSASNSDTADKWKTARTLTLTGAVTGSTSVDGSGNISIATTTNHTHSDYIPKSIGTAKGDIVYWSAASTPARLAIGANGKVLKVVSGVPAWGDVSIPYGETLPSTGTNGDVFLQTSAEYYELPAGGTTGQVLAKSSNADRAVQWVSSINISPSSAKFYPAGSTVATTNSNPQVFNTAIYVENNVLFGAAWNDYAEYRESLNNINIQSGRCVVENGDDTIKVSIRRMEPGASIVSDTYGFAIGKTEMANLPIAVSGRVLAYPYEDKEEFKKNIGKPVCSGPNGTVSIMTDEEYRNYGYCAIGTISSVPDYDVWGENNIKVNGRVWIKVR